jgi:hypothetical protein
MLARAYNSVAALILLVAGNASATVAETAPSAPEAVRVLETVTVAGTLPGPGLWKVSSGARTLWILGTVSPLPRKMQWYSPQSEALLRQTSEVIGPPRVGAELGWGGAFKMAFAMPTMLRARKNADGKTLREVLPADLYARWQPLKARYLRNDDSIEGWRPLFAAAKLYEAALDSAGLEYGDRVTRRIDSLADKYDIKATPASIELKISDPKGLAKSFTHAEVDDSACFRSVLDQMDADLAHAAQRANAWAVGDVPELLRLVRRERNESCLDVFRQVEAIRELGAVDAYARAQDKWLLAVDAALAANDTSFSTLPMRELVADDGLLARLRAKGYLVETPE